MLSLVSIVFELPVEEVDDAEIHLFLSLLDGLNRELLVEQARQQERRIVLWQPIALEYGGDDFLLQQVFLGFVIMVDGFVEIVFIEHEAKQASSFLFLHHLQFPKELVRALDVVIQYIVQQQRQLSS